MNNNTIVYCHATDLKVHPLNKALPAWADDDPRFIELCASILECGIRVPLICDQDRQVIDGAHRLRAAKRVGLHQVPVIVESAAEVASTIITTLVDRKHYTKGQMAYICAPLFDAAYKEAKQRRASTALAVELPKTSELLAARLGISSRLLEQARELIRIFAEDAEFKADMEPRVLAPDDPVGLGAAIAGYAGRKSTKGKGKENRDAEQLWFKNFGGLFFQSCRLPDVKGLAPKLRDELAGCMDAGELKRLGEVGRTIAQEARRRLKEINKSR